MGGWHLADIAACAVAVVIVVAVGFVLIEDYGEVGNHSPDATQYLRMAAGEQVPDPYANRVLGPALAGALPGSPETGFRVLTFASLASALLAAALLSLRTGASRSATICAVILTATSPAVAYSFANPFLTDAPALAAGSIAAVAFVLGAWPAFLVALVLAVGFRDGSTAVALVWLPQRQYRRLIISGLCALASLGLARLVADPDGSFLYIGMPSWSRWLVDLVRSWGPLWLVGSVGLLTLRAHRARVLTLAGVLLLTGIALTFIFSDTERMLLPLLPVVLVGTAHLLGRAASRTAAAVLALMVAATPLLAFRNVLIPESSPMRASEGLRIGVLLAGVAAAGRLTIDQQRRADRSP